MKRTTLAVLLAALSLLALASAGAMPTTAGAAACKKAKAATSAITKAQARSAVRCLVNKRRRGARNLKQHRKVQRAAQGHSRKMRNSSCFSHRCPGEPGIERRLVRTGYTAGARRWAVGEVILTQPKSFTPKRAVRSWMRSPTHRAILKARGYRHIGVGLAARNRLVYWTVVVASKRG